ncbi:MAG: hypothetical protein SVM79_08415 [Chloroflexota bacterium]|nr:hypothetical protein [Chloroflexota bacterium]
MDKDDLIRKLESVAVPQFELQSHKERLKGELLNSDCLRERPRVSILGLTKLKEGVEMLREYISRQPIWKTAIAGVTALALIATLSIAVPSLTGKPDVVLAAEIARNSPEVKIASGGEGEIEVVKVVKVVGNKGTVVCVAQRGQVVTAQVDLETEKVVEVEALPMPELGEAERQEAIKIAKADPRVKELLDKGGSIGMLFPIYTGGMITTNGKTEVLPTVMKVMVEIKLGKKTQLARVNLEGKKVEEVIEPVVAVAKPVINIPYPGGEVNIGEIIGGEVGMTIAGPLLPAPPLTEGEKAEAIDIAKSDPQVRELLDKGATLGEVLGCFMAGFVESEDGKQVEMSAPSQVKVIVPLELGEEYWTVEVDLNNKQVSRVVPNRVERIDSEVVIEEAVEVIVDVPEAEKR